MIGYGDSGHILKPSGREINNIEYIHTEHVSNGQLFDFCYTMGAMGEDIGRFLFSQMLDALDYMHKKKIIHRNLKMENILVDENF